jgi:hypothetical protein
VNEFLEILKLEGQELVNEFKKASLQGKGTPQEVSDRREGSFVTLIQRYYPFPFRITKGIVMDSYGKRSDSIDCIICNPNHPYTIDTSGKHSFLFADGIDAAIELKPDLKNKVELFRGLKQIQSLKQLRRVETPLLGSYGEKRIELSRTIPSFIFSNEAKSNVDDTVNEIYSYYVDNNVPLEEQFDFIVINGLGIICNFKIPELNRRENVSGLPKYGYWFEEWNELTIAAFLLYLDISDPAIPKITTGILERYLGKAIKPFNGKRFNSLNKFWSE